MTTRNGCLAGQRVLLTGAAGGIGRGLALGLAAHGADLVLAGRTRAALDEVAEELRATGASATVETVDIEDRASCAEMARRIEATGPITVLVNNAGVIEIAPIDSDDVDAVWDRVVGTNLTGAFNMVRAVMDQLVKARGSIINVTSITADVYTNNTVGYSASKGGLRSLTMALSRELGPKGVRVNAVAPGVIATRMSTSLKDPEKLRRLEARVSLGRIGQPQDIAGPVAFLASDMAAYVTGTTLVVDGGYTTA